MISIRMLKPYDRFAKGDVLSHHDVVAQAWINRGLAEKVDGDATPISNIASKPSASAAEVEKIKAEAIAAMKQTKAECEAKLKDAESKLAQAGKDVKAANEMADLTHAELKSVTTERDELAKQLKNARDELGELRKTAKK